MSTMSYRYQIQHIPNKSRNQGTWRCPKMEVTPTPPRLWRWRMAGLSLHILWPCHTQFFSLRPWLCWWCFSAWTVVFFWTLPKVGAIWTDLGHPQQPQNGSPWRATSWPGQCERSSARNSQFYQRYHALHPVRDTRDTFVGSKLTKHKDI